MSYSDVFIKRQKRFILLINLISLAYLSIFLYTWSTYDRKILPNSLVFDIENLLKDKKLSFASQLNYMLLRTISIFPGFFGFYVHTKTDAMELAYIHAVKENFGTAYFASFSLIIFLRYLLTIIAMYLSIMFTLTILYNIWVYLVHRHGYFYSYRSFFTETEFRLLFFMFYGISAYAFIYAFLMNYIMNIFFYYTIIAKLMEILAKLTFAGILIFNIFAIVRIRKL